MKIWGNHLKVGDTIYYEYAYDIRQSTVKERDTKTFRMPSLIMENGNRIFCCNHLSNIKLNPSNKKLINIK